MVSCTHDGCSWRAIAPSPDAARRQHAEHLVAEHATEVDADVPEGMVQVKLHADGEWVTTTPERARDLQASARED